MRVLFLATFLAALAVNGCTVPPPPNLIAGADMDPAITGVVARMNPEIPDHVLASSALFPCVEIHTSLWTQGDLKRPLILDTASLLHRKGYGGIDSTCRESIIRIDLVGLGIVSKDDTQKFLAQGYGTPVDIGVFMTDAAGDRNPGGWGPFGLPGAAIRESMKKDLPSDPVYVAVFDLTAQSDGKEWHSRLVVTGPYTDTEDQRVKVLGASEKAWTDLFQPKK